MSIAFAVLVVALYGARAWQDLSSPSAWDYWKDQYVSPSLTASTARIEVNGQTRTALAVRGEIGAAAAGWFRDRVSEARLASGDVIVLSSPGGRLDQSMIMGEAVRSLGLTTMVGTVDAQGRVQPSYCASACVLVYAGGRSRLAVSGSTLGVHQFSREQSGTPESASEIIASTQRTTGIIFDYMTRMGVSPSILPLMSARSDMRWLNEKEAFDLKLSTDRFGPG